MRFQYMAGRQSFRGKSFFSTICLAAIGALFLFSLISTPRVRAQAPQTAAAPSPSFEVASVRQNHSGTRGRLFKLGDPSRFVTTNMPTKDLIEFAYNIKDFQISGGPGWIAGQGYDIQATVEDSLVAELQKLSRDQRSDQFRLMLRSRLADRFKLSLSHSTKELPGFALVIAKGGSKLTEVAPPDPQATPAPPPPSPGNGRPPLGPGGFMLMMQPGGIATLTANTAPINNLVNLLSMQLGRPVLDQTGLKGTYSFTLKFISETGLGGGPLPPAPPSADAPDTAGTSIFTAIQDQLGLKLESTKTPVESYVIEHIEEPSEN
jgi:bla regulator protein blaR1